MDFHLNIYFCFSFVLVRLSHEWQAYISQTHKLRKVFVSVKGIYYQVDIQNFLYLIAFMRPVNFFGWVIMSAASSRLKWRVRKLHG